VARVRLKFVSQDEDRHGNIRYYFRKRGLKTKTRLPGPPGSEEFMAAYSAALDGRTAPIAAGFAQTIMRAKADSLRWLCAQYMADPGFKQLDIKTSTNRRRIFDLICAEPIADNEPTPIGDAPFAELTTKHIRLIRNRKSGTPEEANNWLKALRALFKWAVLNEHCDFNPAKEVEKFKSAGEGFHTWSISEVEQYEKCFDIGTKARLALALLLYTGARLSDVILFGPDHVANGGIKFTAQKGKNRKPITLEIPILPELAHIIAASPVGEKTFLETEYGQPFSADGFGRRFRKWCDRAGLKHCTAHGLRKAGATIAANNGATATQLMAIFGWTDINQAELYTRKADQKKLARDSMHLLAKRDDGEGSVSHF
jgi:integrase